MVVGLARLDPRHVLSSDQRSKVRRESRIQACSKAADPCLTTACMSGMPLWFVACSLTDDYDVFAA